MSSAVRALIDAQDHGPRHAGSGRYRAWCACCAPEADGAEGKPRRRNRAKPVLAWRARLEVQLAGTDVGDASLD